MKGKFQFYIIAPKFVFSFTSYIEFSFLDQQTTFVCTDPSECTVFDS